MKNKKIVIGVLLVATLIMAVGYSIFSTALNISGTANIASTWSVMFTGIEEVSKTSGVTVKSAPTANGTSATFNVDLKSPGDKIVYNITLSNKGSLDAIINNISASETGSDAIYFTITGIKKGDVLNKNTSKIITVEIGFSSSVISQPIDVENKLTISVECVQNLGQNIPSGDINIEKPTLTTISGTNTVTLSNSVERALASYKIYGNSLQNGTPSPSSPIEVSSVGEKTKNLLDFRRLIPTDSYTSQGIEYSLKEDGILVNGISDGFAATQVVDVQNLLEVGKTYSLTGGDSGVSVIFLSIVNGTSNYNATKTITGQETSVKVYLQVISGKEVDNVLIKPLLIETNSDTSYEPYGYNIPVKVNNGSNEEITNIYLDEPLRKVGDVSDYIDFENKRVVRNIKVYQMTGKEDILYLNYSGVNQFYFNYSNFIHDKDNPVVISNYYKSGTVNNRVNNYNTVYTFSSGFAINDNNFSSAEDFKNFVVSKASSSNPILIYYQLSTPIYETISLPNIKALNCNTTVTIDTNTNPSKIDVSYYKKQ